MLDTLLRPLIDPPLSRVAKSLSDQGFMANRITWIGFVLGLAGCVCAGFQAYIPAMVLILLSRGLDILDGAVARAGGRVTEWGAYLDITLDFVIYAAFPVFFILGQPEHALAAAFLLFSYIGTASTFLAFAIIAAKRGLTTTERGEKSFYHQGGIVGATETVLFIMVCCLYPEAFSAFAVIFGLLCGMTALQRFMHAKRVFGMLPKTM
jgi:phosphatidylglycerophosphate synthase